MPPPARTGSDLHRAATPVARRRRQARAGRQPLHSRLGLTRFALMERLRLIRGLARALADVHAHRWTHGNPIKPPGEPAHHRGECDICVLVPLNLL